MTFDMTYVSEKVQYKLTLYVRNWESLQVYVRQKGSTNKIVWVRESLPDVDTVLHFVQLLHILIDMEHLPLHLK